MNEINPVINVNVHCTLYLYLVRSTHQKAGGAKVKAEEAATARQAKTAVSAKQKVEKEKRGKEESECLAILHRAKVREEYASIVGMINDHIEKTSTSTSSDKRKYNTPPTTTATTKTEKKPSSASPSSSILTKAVSKNTPTVVAVVVTQEDIVKHANNIHDERHTIIHTVFRRE